MSDKISRGLRSGAWGQVCIVSAASSDGHEEDEGVREKQALVSYAPTNTRNATLTMTTDFELDRFVFQRVLGEGEPTY